jgi:hypothetical protein
MVLDVKSVDRLLVTWVPYAYAIKVGPWIFLTGHEAYDWEAGTSDEVTGPLGFRFMRTAAAVRAISSAADASCPGRIRLRPVACRPARSILPGATSGWRSPDRGRRANAGPTSDGRTELGMPHSMPV